MRNCKSVKHYGENQCFMYFMGRQVLNANMSNGYILFYVKDIDLQHGDIRPWISNTTFDGAMNISCYTLKDP